MFFVKPDDAQALDAAFQKILREAGLPNGLPLNFSEIPGASTTADMTFWVDTNGNDNGSGDQSAPLKTISEAIRRIPLVVKHNVTININAGTYVELLAIGNLIIGTPSISLIGQSWVTPTLASGATSGVVASMTSNVVSVTGAKWTVNDLRGHFLKITSGAQSGKYLPIASNTANTIEVSFFSALVAGTTFEIVDPGVIIQNPATETSAARISFGVNIYDFSYGVKFSNLWFKTNSSGTTTAGNGSVSYTYCRFESSSSTGYCIYKYGPIGGCLVSYCYLNSKNGLQVTAGQAGVEYSYVRQAATGGLGLVASSSSARPNLTVTGSIIEGFDGGGGVLASSQHSGVYIQANTIIRSCKYGIHLSGAFATLLSTNVTVTGNQIGLYVEGRGVKEFTVASGAITSNTSGGIVVKAPSCSGYIYTSCSISNNTGYGIYLGTAAELSGMNSVTIASNVTMTGNSIKDLTIDGGTTTSTIADARLLPTKTLVDLDLLNRIYCA